MFSKVKVAVLVQYIDENGKNKGGRNFSFETSSDVLMYCNDTEKIIQDMINDWQAKHNYCGKYTYVSHEVDFFGEVVLDGADFLAKVQAINEAAQEDKDSERLYRGIAKYK